MEMQIKRVNGRIRISVSAIGKNIKSKLSTINKAILRGEISLRSRIFDLLRCRIVLIIKRLSKRAQARKCHDSNLVSIATCISCFHYRQTNYKTSGTLIFSSVGTYLISKQRTTHNAQRTTLLEV